MKQSVQHSRTEKVANLYTIYLQTNKKNKHFHFCLHQNQLSFGKMPDSAEDEEAGPEVKVLPVRKDKSVDCDCCLAFCQDFFCFTIAV